MPNGSSTLTTTTYTSQTKSRAKAPAQWVKLVISTITPERQKKLSSNFRALGSRTFKSDSFHQHQQQQQRQLKKLWIMHKT